MAITRRQFLKCSGTAAAGALLAPRLFGSSFVQDALAAIGNRYFVVIYLDGGNDGLNTVVPTGGALRPWYESARKTGSGGLRLGLADLGNTAIANDPNTGSALALHPGFRAPTTGAGAGGLHALYQAGKVAVVQGCGYPRYSLSHEDSRLIFQTGDPSLSLYSGTGWIGRHLASAYAGQPGAIPGINIRDSVAADFRQSTTSVLAVRRLRDFSFPYDAEGDYNTMSERAARNAAFTALHSSAQGGADPGFKYIGSAGATTLASTNSYPALHSLYNNNPSRNAFGKLYDNGTPPGVNRSLSRDLLEVAKVINGTELGAVNSRFFWVENGGYDTHSDQGAGATDGQHFSLHSELGASLKVFYDDLADMGVADRVCIMVYSEFSRRIPQNENGTDHGSQAPMFLIGGKVAGGVYGNHPRIEPVELDGEGNTRYRQNGSNAGFESTDFRDIYGTILNKWMSVNPTDVLTLDSGDPTRNWTVANFNMPLFTP